MTITPEQQTKLETWGPGPWVDEPDRQEWSAHGLPCIITRHDVFGSLCGYVAVPPGHPLHGMHYDTAAVSQLEAHGTVNYSEACQGKVCHVPAPGEPDDVWWFGFDCGHFEDYYPGLSPDLASCFPSGRVYRDIGYVRAEVEALASQLAALQP